ncbi:Rrf2 family transcriptional regulator [Mucilaginibacter sp. L3T2-6]|uniref:RrF2 family transcriptional regulator n=1 Tax=Mucilaginibacter sp. L3T2-6 TaxID=3062491 RepID=UPI002677262B|nr:Rrf2 family transcriptional regulator [Mucilaginibacter sp. L3T2-6]MDO3641381.1 Rrf2 family transcriptional regulator [Mucilaginibacter sp. L3T2-6]MDV6213858.1 Rrf2 family transcriptional regulator [Mucilaginibacter sp. L3T2-6]
MGVFSKTCEYAIRAVFFIAHKTASGGRVGIKEVAAGIDSPEPFLAKILQDLSRKGIVQSAKGPNGGFYLDADALKRPLTDIVEAVDGNALFTGCALGLKQCSEVKPCPLHGQFKIIRGEIHELLETTKIGKFNQELILGINALKK